MGPRRETRHTLPTALRALRRNMVRAALTILGIVIGVAAVIAMMEIGQGTSSPSADHRRAWAPTSYRSTPATSSRPA